MNFSAWRSVHYSSKLFQVNVRFAILQWRLGTRLASTTRDWPTANWHNALKTMLLGCICVARLHMGFSRGVWRFED